MKYAAKEGARTTTSETFKTQLQTVQSIFLGKGTRTEGDQATDSGDLFIFLLIFTSQQLLLKQYLGNSLVSELL